MKKLLNEILWFTGLLFWVYNISLIFYFLGKYAELHGMLAAMGAK